MKFVGEYKEHLFTSDGAVAVTFTAKGEEKNKARQIAEEMRTSLQDGKDAVKYEINIKKYSPKRSVKANERMWALIGELSKKRKVPKEDIYREYIIEQNIYVPHTLPNDEVEPMCYLWEHSGHIGRIAEIKGQGETQTTVLFHKGSSEYTVREMFLLTEMIVKDCLLEGIDPDTPEEKAYKKALRGSK
jgi:hypothetical protein